MRKAFAGFVGAFALSLTAAAPTLAQKSADTLRIAVTDPWSTLDPYYFPQDEAAFFYRTIYESLVAYDERKHEFVPRLAKAWRRIDSRTLEFDLRNDVKFHNGDRFDAEDVKYTIDYIRDPKTQLRFKDRYDWVESVEIVDPYKVRVVSKAAFATDLQLMAYRYWIYNSKVHKKLENKADYGRVSPITTGPYRVVSMDPQKGMVLERFDDYYDKSGRYRAPIKRVVVIPIADRQTQVAQFFTGGVDVLRNVPADMARDLARMPDARITPTHAGMLMYVTLDAAGRSDNKVMTDHRVRKAFMMAVDRQQLARTVIPGGEIADILDGICVRENIGCSTSTKPPAYDPDGARKLLAEAGYPDGFDMELNVHAPIKEIGEAVAGQIRKVGIRATVRPLPLALYVRLRGEGKMTAFTGFYPTGAQPDIENIFDFFFNGNRDYWNDPVIKETQRLGFVEFDQTKRTEIYRKGIDQVNTKNYILPLADLPIVFVHRKDVRIAENPLSTIDYRLGDIFWN
jgi:peptide/nickel transport system substrate-binding protein